MAEPIHSGCLAEVVDGLLGKDSPNLGLVVKVIARVGEHRTLGAIWRCQAEYAQRGQEGYAFGHRPAAPEGTADFAQSWLRKLPDPPAPAATKTQEKELTT